MSKRRMISPVVDTLIVGTLPEVPEVINVIAPITSDHIVITPSVPAPAPAPAPPAQQQEEVPEGNAETIVPVIDAVEVAKEEVPAATSRPIPPPLMVQARATKVRKPVGRPKKATPAVDDLGDDCDDQDDDGSATRPGSIRIKEMFEMAKAHGLQSAKPARALIKATFPRPDQHALAVLVMKTALEATSNQQRKRVLVRDVEPLISLLSVLSLNPSLIMPPRV